WEVAGPAAGEKHRRSGLPIKARNTAFSSRRKTGYRHGLSMIPDYSYLLPGRLLEKQKAGLPFPAIPWQIQGLWTASLIRWRLTIANDSFTGRMKQCQSRPYIPTIP